MRDSYRKGLIPAVRVGVALVLVAAIAAACASPEPVIVTQTPASERAERRAFDGAPPVVAHEDFGADCMECHEDGGVEIDGLGVSPASPHGATAGMSVNSRCRQCHVFKQTDEIFVASNFEPLRQDLRRGKRQNLLAPPVIPHLVLMRENCQACHSGETAREEIRTPHPERLRCKQCHVPAVTTAEFSR